MPMVADGSFKIQEFDFLFSRVVVNDRYLIIFLSSFRYFSLLQGKIQDLSFSRDSILEVYFLPSLLYSLFPYGRKEGADKFLKSTFTPSSYEVTSSEMQICYSLSDSLL